MCGAFQRHFISFHADEADCSNIYLPARCISLWNVTLMPKLNTAIMPCAILKLDVYRSLSMWHRFKFSLSFQFNRELPELSYQINYKTVNLSKVFHLHVFVVDAFTSFSGGISTNIAKKSVCGVEFQFNW